MRKLSLHAHRDSALTARFASPFLRGSVTTPTNVTNHDPRGNPSTRSDRTLTDRDFAEAAIRLSRTLW